MAELITKLSLCMIVKNEESTIGPAIESAFASTGGVGGLITECIIEDTGSTDKTLEILESMSSKYPIKVQHCAWTKNFSFHRNNVAAAASNDWIFVLDGDELIPAEVNVKDDLDKINPQVVEQDLEGLLFINDCIMDNGTQRIRNVRIYNRTTLHWKYPVHNQLVSKDETRVMRTGIMPTARLMAFYKGTMDAKVKRSLPMLLDMFNDAENDQQRSIAATFLSSTYAVQKDWREVLNWFYRIPGKKSMQYVDCWARAIFAGLKLNADKEARAILAEALDLFPDSPQIQYIAMFYNMAKLLSCIDSSAIQEKYKYANPEPFMKRELVKRLAQQFGFSQVTFT